MPNDLEQVEFVTDDRDKPEEERMSLRIFRGGNQDWYVAVAPVNEVAINGVRICTSGGAMTSHPGLTAAISDAYLAIHNAENGIATKAPPNRRDMEEELEAWRSKFPNLVFDGLSLQERYID